MLELLYVSVLINIMLVVYAVRIYKSRELIRLNRRYLKTKMLDTGFDQVKNRFDCECG